MAKAAAPGGEGRTVIPLPAWMATSAGSATWRCTTLLPRSILSLLLSYLPPRVTVSLLSHGGLSCKALPCNAHACNGVRIPAAIREAPRQQYRRRSMPGSLSFECSSPPALCCRPAGPGQFLILNPRAGGSACPTQLHPHRCPHVAYNP